eukprot:gene1926-1066_t
MEQEKQQFYLKPISKDSQKVLKSIPLSIGPLTVGGHSSSNIRLKNKEALQYHSSIHNDGNNVYIYILDSQAEIEFKGKKIKHFEKLKLDESFIIEPNQSYAKEFKITSKKKKVEKENDSNLNTNTNLNINSNLNTNSNSTPNSNSNNNSNISNNLQMINLLNDKIKKQEINFKKQILDIEENNKKKKEEIKILKEENEEIKNELRDIQMIKLDFEKDIEIKEKVIEKKKNEIKKMKEKNEMNQEEIKNNEKKIELINEMQKRILNLENENINLESLKKKNEKIIKDQKLNINKLNIIIKQFENGNNNQNENYKKDRNFYMKSFEDKSDECIKLNEELRRTELSLKYQNDELNKIQNELLKYKLDKNMMNKSGNSGNIGGGNSIGNNNIGGLKNDIISLNNQIKNIKVESQQNESKIKKLEIKLKNSNKKKISKEILPIIESFQNDLQDSILKSTKNLKRKINEMSDEPLDFSSSQEINFTPPSTEKLKKKNTSPQLNDLDEDLDLTQISQSFE